MSASVINVVDVKRELLGENEHVLSTGYVVRVKPVSSVLIERITSSIKDPEVPTFWNEERQRDDPNPTSPAYALAIERAQRERGVLALDAMMLMGVELVGGLPEDRKWVAKLKRLGVIPADFDESDEDELTYTFLKYVAFGSEDLGLLTKSQTTEEDVQDAERSFRRN